MSFDAKIVTEDENLPLDANGELLLPAELAEMGAQLKTQSEQLTAAYPASASAAWKEQADHSKQPARRSSMVMSALGGAAAAILLVATSVAILQSWNGVSNGPVAQNSSLDNQALQEEDEAVASLSAASEPAAAGESQEDSAYLRPWPLGSPSPPANQPERLPTLYPQGESELLEEVSVSEMLSRIEGLEEDVVQYQSIVELLFYRLEGRERELRSLRMQLEVQRQLEIQGRQQVEGQEQVDAAGDQ